MKKLLVASIIAATMATGVQASPLKQNTWVEIKNQDLYEQMYDDALEKALKDLEAAIREADKLANDTYFNGEKVVNRMPWLMQFRDKFDNNEYVFNYNLWVEMQKENNGFYDMLTN